jgi:uncharacterized membrane protein
MASLVPYLIFLHIFSAIVAFGPTYAFAIYGAQGAKEPQHANFIARANHLVSDRLVFPIVLSMPVTGILIILASGRDLTKSAWLAAAIVLYVFAVLYSYFVQRPAILRIIELTSTPPPPGSTGGPPPEVVATGAKIRRGGMILGLTVIVIVFLMVVKPGQ